MQNKAIKWYLLHKIEKHYNYNQAYYLSYIQYGCKTVV